MDSITPAAEDTRTENDPPRIPTERERYIDGLRVLATVLENNPRVRLPANQITIHFLDDDRDRSRAAMAEAARAFPCKWSKRFYGGEENSYFDLWGQLGGLMIQMAAFRDAVCKRVVTGTHEVTEKVKDPEELAKVPEIEVTRTVEDVTWDCGSLLAPRQLADPEPKAVTAA